MLKYPRVQFLRRVLLLESIGKLFQVKARQSPRELLQRTIVFQSRKVGFQFQECPLYTFQRAIRDETGIGTDEQLLLTWNGTRMDSEQRVSSYEQSFTMAKPVYLYARSTKNEKVRWESALGITLPN